MLVILLPVLFAQFAAGLWQYTVKKAGVTQDPVNDYRFHCASVVADAREQSGTLTI